MSEQDKNTRLSKENHELIADIVRALVIVIKALRRYAGLPGGWV